MDKKEESNPRTEAPRQEKGGNSMLCALLWPFNALIQALRSLYHWVMSWAERPGGSVALGSISFFESSFFPIPPDPLMCALCLGKRKHSFRFATITTFSSVAGGVFGWALGMYFFTDAVMWGIDLFGVQDTWLGTAKSVTVEAKAMQLDNATLYPDGYLYNAKRLFDEWGFFALFAAAISPIPYKVATIAAGLFGLPFHTLVVGSVLGRGLRFYTLGALLFFFGEHARKFIEKYFALLTILIVVLGLLGFYALKFLI